MEQAILIGDIMNTEYRNQAMDVDGREKPWVYKLFCIQCEDCFAA